MPSGYFKIRDQLTQTLSNERNSKLCGDYLAQIRVCAADYHTCPNGKTPMATFNEGKDFLMKKDWVIA